jgi:hypothetical protein
MRPWTAATAAIWPSANAGVRPVFESWARCLRPLLSRGIFATEDATVLEFFRGIRGTVHVAFEEGTQAQWLYDLLKPRVHRGVVCDPGKTTPNQARVTPP